MQPSIDEVHFPVFVLFPVMNRRLSTQQVDGNILIKRVEVEEVVLDHLSLVAEPYNKFLYAMGGIYLHDMPQYGLPPDFNHGFRSQNGLF